MLSRDLTRVFCLFFATIVARLRESDRAFETSPVKQRVNWNYISVRRFVKRENALCSEGTIARLDNCPQTRLAPLAWSYRRQKLLSFLFYSISRVHLKRPRPQWLSGTQTHLQHVNNLPRVWKCQICGHLKSRQHNYIPKIAVIHKHLKHCTKKHFHILSCWVFQIFWTTRPV